MNQITTISLIGLLAGMIGTTIGGLIGISFQRASNKLLSFILEIASGLMTSIICFDLIPESLHITNITITLIGIIAGIILMFGCSNFISNYIKSHHLFKNNTLLKTGLIISLGLAIHNLPEGLAIGAGFNSSTTLGLKLAIAIALHDIPEGISISLPLNSGGMSKNKAIIITFVSGISTGIGALIGAYIGNISLLFISFSLSFAAGAMLYIVSCELIPESQKIYSGKITSLGYISGIILGIFSQI